MGGGGAFRAAAKVAGVTVANSGFRSVAAEHPVYTAARNVARPVSISGILSSSEDVKSGVVKASSVGASDVSHVQKVVADFDDWEMAGGEEEMMVNHGEPLPRVVFGGAPSLQEATEATSDLKEALEKVYLSNEYGGSCTSSSSLSSVSKACVVSETLVTKSVPKHAIKAFRFLNEVPAAQVVVASIASDQNVWNAVLQNPALQDFLESHKTSGKYMQSNSLKFLIVFKLLTYRPIIAGASSPGSDQMINESDADIDTDSVYQSSSGSTFPKFESGESKSGNSFTAFFHNIKQTVVDMMNSLSDYFNNLFGGDKFFVDANGSAKLGAMEKTLGASFMALAVMVMMVVVSKRGQS